MNRSRLSVGCVVLVLTAGVAQAQSASTSGGREGRWEGYGGLRAIFSESVGFDGGSQIETDDDLGLGFGLGYNYSDHLLIGGEINFNSVDYDGTVNSADTPGLTSAVDGEFDTFAFNGTATWHFLQGPLTPYVSGTIGYTWVDTNIATGPPEIGCWWDPWYGQICDVFVNTKTEDGFTYGAGLGVRWDFRRGWFGRVSYEQRWLDIGKTSGTPDFGGVHVDIGATF